MLRNLTCALAIVALSGCATCREHKAICTAVAAGIIIGVKAAHDGGRVIDNRPAMCKANPESCK